jgi:uncharacterized protein
MRRVRRAHDYTLARHIFEQLLLSTFSSRWLSSTHHRLGWHAPLRIWRERVELAELCGCPPLRVVLASDFHAGPMTHPDVLSAACRAIADLQPDLLLLGGDFVSWHQRYIDDLAPQIGAIPARYGRYAVVGNHDLWADDVPIVRALGRHGVETLINAEVRLPEPYAHVRIYGMDDPTAGEPIPPGALPEHAMRLVLMHAPEGMAQLRADQYQLALAGHTHGGQIALPGGYPVGLLPGSYSQRYSAGRYTVEGGRTLLVSRGVGYGDFTARWNAPADILVCTLVGA